MKKVKILFLVLISILYISKNAYTQDFRSSFIDKLRFGGNLGLSFGDITLIDISPVVGYQVSKNFEAGIGLTYKYYNQKNFFVNPLTGEQKDLTSQYYGASIYGRYHIISGVFVHAEYEKLLSKFTNYEFIGNNARANVKKVQIDSFFIGGGYQQLIGENSYVFIMALWNLIDNPYSPYQNPIIRAGVIIGR